MGATNSTPAGAEYVFKNDAQPTTFSNNFLSSLENSAETDSTRAKAVQAHIQAEVTAALAASAAATSAAAASSAAAVPEPADAGGRSSGPLSDLAELAAGLADPAAARRQSAGRAAVAARVDELRAKLAERARSPSSSSAASAAGEGGPVARAQAEMVACLRLKDRRPLDCWAEVAAFKAEVAAMEREYIAKTLG